MYLWLRLVGDLATCMQKARVGFISVCVSHKQKQHRGARWCISNSGTFHNEELQEMLWCQTEEAPFRKMVNVTVFGSKLSSSPCSPPMPSATIFFYSLPQWLAIKHLQVVLLQQFGTRDTQIRWRGGRKKKKKKRHGAKKGRKESLWITAGYQTVCLGPAASGAMNLQQFGRPWVGKGAAQTDRLPFTTGSN